MPNRIAYWREQRGMSQQQLADALGVSQASVNRYELGRQPLTVALMQDIASILRVSPIDLLSVAMAAEIRPDLILVPPTPGAASTAMAAKGLITCAVTTNVLERAGIAQGAVCIFDCTEAAIDGVETGAIVAVRARINEMDEEILILRQYVSPGLSTTNRAGMNVAVASDDPSFSVEIHGVLISHERTTLGSGSNS